MTEEEAKTKWCPMVRVTADNGMYGDNRQDGGGAYYCIASDCMMWRNEYVCGTDETPPTMVGGYCGLIKCLPINTL